CWRATRKPGATATAIRSRWPTCCWYPRCTTHAAITAIFPPCLRLRALRRPASSSTRSCAPSLPVSPTPKIRHALNTASRFRAPADPVDLFSASLRFLACGDPLADMVEAVEAPEGFVAHKHERGAEDATRHGVFDFLLQA